MQARCYHGAGELKGTRVTDEDTRPPSGSNPSMSRAATAAGRTGYGDRSSGVGIMEQSYSAR